LFCGAALLPAPPHLVLRFAWCAVSDLAFFPRGSQDFFLLALSFFFSSMLAVGPLSKLTCPTAPREGHYPLPPQSAARKHHPAGVDCHALSGIVALSLAAPPTDYSSALSCFSFLGSDLLFPFHCAHPPTNRGFRIANFPSLFARPLTRPSDDCRRSFPDTSNCLELKFASFVVLSVPPPPFLLLLPGPQKCP